MPPFRRKLLSTRPADIGCLLVMLTFIPATFIFELTVVLPYFHDPTGIFYRLTMLLGIFLVFNLKGNMLACMFIDTSIKSELLTPPTQKSLRSLWRYCSDCETLAPPRSWHCPICKTCILKRDHHCLFTGGCIGHRNHRYFVLFLLYLAIGSTYTMVYNSIYFWWYHADSYANFTTAIKMLFPLLMFPLDMTWRNFYLLIYELNAIGSVFSWVFFFYHWPILLRGASTDFEANAAQYDLGWRRNLEMVLGKRMHLTWLSPFISSELPHDGVHWETVVQQTVKSR